MTQKVSDDRSFSIGMNNFKLRKVDAMSQFHIVRRVGPLLSEILPILGKIKMKEKDLEGMTEEQKFEQLTKIVAPIMNGLSKLSDDDANFVLFRLLSCVEIQQTEFGGAWSDIATFSGIKMQNLELPVLLQAAGRSLMFNLAGFLALSPRKSGATV